MEIADKLAAEKIVQDAMIDGGVTFDVDDVEVSTKLLPKQKMKASVEVLTKTPVEACDNYSADVVEQWGYNTLVFAADAAYSNHLPLILSPDIIWLTIAQGLARHIENNAEELRHHFVKHEGKELIEIRRDNFIRKSPENPWADTWPEFSAKIKKHIGEEAHSLIMSNFSTTGPIEQAASEITLMDCMQSYFEYGVSTMCGIPKVTVQGTKDDWTKILNKVDAIEKYGLDWWCPILRTIINEFINVFDGNVDESHWKCLYKESGGSGGPYISGWITNLYPYLKTKEYGKYDAETRKYPEPVVHHKTKNWMLERGWTNQRERSFGGGLTHDAFPASYSSVPFWWNYYGTKFDYEFIGGILAVDQNPGMLEGVRPRIGWAVREKVA